MITANGLAALRALASGGLYGAQVVERTSIKVGSVYYVLARLLEDGMVDVRSVKAEFGGKDRQVFTITPLGEEAIAFAERMGR